MLSHSCPVGHLNLHAHTHRANATQLIHFNRVKTSTEASFNIQYYHEPYKQFIKRTWAFFSLILTANKYSTGKNKHLSSHLNPKKVAQW